MLRIVRLWLFQGLTRVVFILSYVLYSRKIFIPSIFSSRTMGFYYNAAFQWTFLPFERFCISNYLLDNINLLCREIFCYSSEF